MYQEMYQQGLNTLIPSDGKIIIPEGFENDSHIIIPDTIVTYCAHRFQLAQQGKKGIDPLCGFGTIPRVINLMGGHCIGIEIDKPRYHTAQQLAGIDVVMQGNFLTTAIQIHFFDYIFTSLPFAWFKDEESFAQLDDSVAHRFRELITDDGLIFLDIVPIVERDGSLWPVGQLHYDYFVRNGFELIEVIAFQNTMHVDTSSISVIFVMKPS